MTPGLYAAASAMNARQNAQEVIARNMAASHTQAFRRQAPVFKTFQHEMANATGERPFAAGVEMESSPWDFTAGPTTVTNRDQDFALRGEGFFTIQGPDGLYLTRDGHFRRNDEDVLVTEDGHPVLGIRGPLVMREGTVAVQEDGTVLLDGRSVDRLKLVLPERINELISSGGGVFTAAEDNELKPAVGAQVVNGALEGSNVNTPEEMVLMLENSRMAEMAGRCMTIANNLMGRAIQDLSG